MPYTYLHFRSECAEAISRALQKTGLVRLTEIPLEIPPSPELGELSSSISFEVASRTRTEPLSAANLIAENLDISTLQTIESVSVEGAGYINFRFNLKKMGTKILAEILGSGNEYGLAKTDKPKKVIVEHTSANPSGPLHLGQARNAILGDALVRILRSRGHEVKVHYYIDDVGKQVAIVALGFRLLKGNIGKGKIDQRLGFIYAATNCVIQIEDIRRRLRQLDNSEQTETKRTELMRHLDEWVSTASELIAIDEETFQTIADAIAKMDNPAAHVERLMRNYERRESEDVKLLRNVVELCLQGVNETLRNLEVQFDQWDWESELVWSGETQSIIDKLAATKFTERKAGTVILLANDIADKLQLRERLVISPNYEIPNLTLERSDGTTLYTTRDIAYTLRKFQQAEMVVNVIGVEQTLAQLQVKLALSALGQEEKARSLVHYAYGLVELPGMRMSKRRSRYITLDELIIQAVNRVSEEVEKRSGESTPEDRRIIARRIAMGAIRYAMLNVSNIKTITFTWNRVLSLERNSAPFINYAYTRTHGIMRKLERTPSEFKADLLSHPLERFLLIQLGRFPEIFIQSAENLRPEDIAVYANMIAEKFHEYYEKAHVIRAESEELKYARAALVMAVQIVLRNAMRLLGIELSEKM